MRPLTNPQKRLVALIQEELPLIERPFSALGAKCGLAESEVMENIQLFKEDGVIRQISAIFDTRCLGYRSSLVAMRVDPQKENEAAEVINSHPGVTHNYRRNHAFNLWFTVAVPPTSRIGLEKTVDLFHSLAKAESTRLMPTLKLFKIGVNLDITGENSPDKKEAPRYTEEMRHRSKNEITEKEIQFIRVMQEDMPVVSMPYHAMAEQLGMGQDELFEMAARFVREGKLRRMAAVLNHRKAGFVANAMGVWEVPPERIAEVGVQMGSFSAVSHCYQRPVYPDWPYSIFTMVHGRDKEACDKILESIAAATGMNRYEALFSTKEYKKTRLKYFTPEIENWEEERASICC
ncbi:MAG: Lrp/AsnC family transcriptional regulator [Candidatus Omnitrophica bacterium]|nr:Lrp/AsnC family transcriptional regulator [Candidatus Omnitrophota bacterium]